MTQSPPPGFPPSDTAPPASGLARLIRALLYGFSVLLFVPLLPFNIRIVAEYERGVIFRLGRLQGAKGPGLSCCCPSSTGW